MRVSFCSFPYPPPPLSSGRDKKKKGWAADCFWFERLIGIATRHAVGLPIHVYPMYENAFRARRKQNIKENHGESARLYAEFARIAAQSEYSWNYGRPPATEQEIGSVSIRNRMICFPCEFGNSFPGNCKGFNACASPDPLLMNAFNNVNLAAAAVMTSVEVARELGIPENKWIYPLGGAGTKDSEHCKFDS